ncbi:MAG: hypothetical protein VX938_04780, partial [Myxococcota bacterium]|nr:hypothetical protein [Myxococcota bacterium]
GDHTPEVLDDFATVLSVALANLDFGTLGELGNFWSDSDPGVVDETFMLGDVPVTLKGDALYSANIKSVTAPTADVSLDSREGGLMMAGDFNASEDASGLFITLNVLAELPIEVAAEIDLNGLSVSYNDTINPYVEWLVTVEVENFDFMTDSDISKVAGQDLSVQIVDMEVNANGLDIEPFANVLIDLGEIDLPFIGDVDLGIWELESLVGPLSNVLGDGFIDPIAELLVDVMTSDFLMPFVQNEMHPLLEQMIQSLATDRAMEIAPLIGDGEPVVLTIDSELGTVTFTDAGADISVDAMAMGPDTLSLPSPGSILRVSCNGSDPGNYTFPKQDEMEVGLHMDLLNQVLYAAWRAGAFDFSLGGSALGGAATTIGLSTPQVQAKPMLPPIVDDCNSKKQLEVQIGDIRLDGSFVQNGQSVSLVAYVSATSDIVPVIENGTVSLVLGGLSNVTVEVEELQGGTFDEATFANFVEDVVVPDLLVGLAEGPLAELPLPTMQPSLIADWFPEDVELSIGTDMDVVHLKGTLGIAGSLH